MAKRNYVKPLISDVTDTILPLEVHGATVASPDPLAEY
jgi:hypothetical protein